MTRAFREAYIYGWRPGTHSRLTRDANYVIEAEDINIVDLTQRVDDLKDTARVEIHNPGGKYTGDDAPFDMLQHGDRVEFAVAWRPLRAYGSGTYGSGYYQPGLAVRWTGIIRNWSVDADGAGIFTISFEAEDFPYAIMSMRNHSNAWRDEQICSGPGPGQGIINTILEIECPEIDLSQLPVIEEETTITLADENVLDAIVELANRAGMILYARRTSVHLEDPGSIATKFHMDADDYTLFSYQSNDDQIFNRVRVQGGRNYAIHESQEQQNWWRVVTETERIQQQIATRKAEVDRVEIWTDPNRTGVDEDLTVRLQRDDNGEPVDPDDEKSDIARKTLSQEFLGRDNWTMFNLPEHSLGDYDPWLIIEAEGEIGQAIGVRSDGALTYRSYYPYSVQTRRDTPTSQTQYRLREDTVDDTNIDEFEEARHIGDSFLSQHSEPDLSLEVDADSTRLHELKTGEVVRATIPEVGADGRFVCVDRSIEWDGSNEYATVTLRDLTSL